jgi:hypothetical protein
MQSGFSSRSEGNYDFNKEILTLQHPHTNFLKGSQKDKMFLKHSDKL